MTSPIFWPKGELEVSANATPALRMQVLSDNNQCKPKTVRETRVECVRRAAGSCKAYAITDITGWPNFFRLTAWAHCRCGPTKQAQVERVLNIFFLRGDVYIGALDEAADYTFHPGQPHRSDVMHINVYFVI